jgi:hypothetical protein
LSVLPRKRERTDQATMARIISPSVASMPTVQTAERAT